MTKYLDIKTVSMVGKPGNAISPQQYINRINDKILKNNLTHVKFNGFVGAWSGSSTRAEVECEKHGEWTCTIGNFIHQTIDCPKCLGCKKLSSNDINHDVLEILSSDIERSIYTYHGIEMFNGKDSLLKLECPIHGIWKTTNFNNFKVHGYKCPSCSSYNLKHKVVSQDDLYFYILKSDDHFKIGVSKDIKRRKYDIELTSKRKYELYLHEYIGHTNEIEKYIKSKGYNNYFTKEEYGCGYTETVGIDKLDEVVEIIKEYLK